MFFQETCSVICEFGEEEGVDKRTINRCCKAVEKSSFSKLSTYDLFLLFDALGCYEQRDDYMEALYNYIAQLWRASANMDRELSLIEERSSHECQRSP